MSHEIFTGNFLTGEKSITLHPEKGTWSRVLNSAGTIKCTIDLSAENQDDLVLRELTTPWLNYLAWDEEGQMKNAGPILQQNYDDDTGKLEITAAGARAYWYRRLGMAWPVVNPTTDAIIYSGLDLGSIGNDLVFKMMQWPNGAPPIILPPLRTGTRTKTYNAFDLNNGGDLLDNLTNLIGGPDIDFDPERLPFGGGVQWRYRSGTETDPELHGDSASSVIWDHSAAQSSVLKLSVVVTAANLNSETYALGGGQTDELVFGHAVDTTLLQAGYPLLQATKSLNSVSELATANAYASQLTEFGRAPVETWKFTARANQAPLAGSYREGDYCSIVVGKHKFIRPGKYPMRILAIEGDMEGETVDITVSPSRVLKEIS